MKKSPLLLAFVFTAGLISACNSKETITGQSVFSSDTVYPDDMEKTYKVADYKEIKVSRAVHVIFTQSADYGIIRATGPKELLEIFEISCKGDQLSIGFSSSAEINIKQRTVTVRIPAPAPEEIKVSSAAVFRAGQVVAAGSLSLDASSAGKIDIDTLAATELETEASSAATIEVSRRCRINGALKAEASSAAKIDICGIASREVTATVSSAAHIELEGTTENAGFAASSAGCIDAGQLNARKGMARASSGGSVKRSFKHDMGSKTSSGGSIR